MEGALKIRDFNVFNIVDVGNGSYRLLNPPAEFNGEDSVSKMDSDWRPTCLGGKEVNSSDAIRALVESRPWRISTEVPFEVVKVRKEIKFDKPFRGIPHIDVFLADKAGIRPKTATLHIVKQDPFGLVVEVSAIVGSSASLLETWDMSTLRPSESSRDRYRYVDGKLTPSLLLPADALIEYRASADEFIYKQSEYSNKPRTVAGFLARWGHYPAMPVRADVGKFADADMAQVADLTLHWEARGTLAADGFHKRSTASDLASGDADSQTAAGLDSDAQFVAIMRLLRAASLDAATVQAAAAQFDSRTAALQQKLQEATSLAADLQSKVRDGNTATRTQLDNVAVELQQLRAHSAAEAQLLRTEVAAATQAKDAAVAEWQIATRPTPVILSPVPIDRLRELITQSRAAQAAYEHEVKEKEQAASACCVCLSSKRDTLILPCRHMCLCEACAAKVTSCPMCRGVVATRVPVFHS